MPQKNFGSEWTKGDGGVPMLAAQSSASAAAASNGQYTPLLVDELGQLRVAAAVSLGANQSVNVTQIGGVTVATGGSGVISVGINSGSNAVNVSQIGGVTPATGGAGILSFNKQLLAGQTIATGGTGVQQVASNLNQVGGQTAATGGAGILSVNIGASGNSVIGSLAANQTINLAQVGGNTAVTGAAGVLSIDNRLIGGQTMATGGTGIQSIDIGRVGGVAAATGGAGILSINKQLLAGQAIATGGTGVQSFDLRNIGGNAAVTAAAGVLSIDLGRVGGSATVTASAGIQRVNAIDAFDIATIYSSGAAKKPTFLQISASASGSNVLVASAASTTYVILAYNIMANGAVNAQFLSSATPMGGIVYMPTAGVGKVAPFCPVGWMQTTAAHSLNLNLSANVAVGGEIVYISI